LPLPDLRRLIDIESLRSYPSVNLFLDRARAARPDFDLTPDNVFEVAGICSRLDGLPLAIELAASRIKLFPPAAMLERLDKRLDLLKSQSNDRPERHQTLRQTIAWSYDLLPEEEQIFFRRLALFTGGFSASSAQAVCFAGEEPECDVYDLISNLLDKSLVRNAGELGGEPRYMLLETIREYGLEQLGRLGELTEVQHRHTRHFLAVAEQAEPHLTGKDQQQWLDRLEADNDNFRAVLLWADRNDQVEMGLRLAGALWRFWVVKGQIIEGRQRLERLLQLPASGVDPSVRAKALSGIGTLLHSIMPRKALSYLKESLDIARSRNDEQALAATLNHLGWAASNLLDYDHAFSYSEEARLLNQKLGQDRGVAVSHNNFGFTQVAMGNFREAISQFEKALALRRKIGDHRGEAYTLSSLAWVLSSLGKYPEAERNANEALRILRPLYDEQLIAWALTHLGNNFLLQADFERAKKELSECARLWETVGNALGLTFVFCLLCRLFLAEGQWDKAGDSLDKAAGYLRESESPQVWSNRVPYLRGLLHAGKGEPEKAMTYLADSLNLRRTYREQLGVVESVEALLSVCKATMPDDLAAQLLGMTAAERERIGAPVPPLDRRRHDETWEYYRSALGETAFSENIEKGAGAEREKLLDRFIDHLQITTATEVAR
jgi:tetratricopeptide (TPR) repeat protein